MAAQVAAVAAQVVAAVQGAVAAVVQAAAEVAALQAVAPVAAQTEPAVAAEWGQASVLAPVMVRAVAQGSATPQPTTHRHSFPPRYRLRSTGPR